MLKGVFILFGFYALGEVTSYLVDRLIPGSVAGMLLLFLALSMKWIKPDTIRQTVKALTENMALFFIPSTVGIMVTYPLIVSNLWAILLSIFVSTWVVMAVVAWLQQKFES